MGLNGYIYEMDEYRGMGDAVIGHQGQGGRAYAGAEGGPHHSTPAYTEMKLVPKERLSSLSLRPRSPRTTSSSQRLV